MSTIGRNISRIRKSLGMTQEDLAKMMGYKSKSTINKIELGINDIPQSKIVQFAEVLGTTPADLMGWNEDEISPSDKKELTEGEKMWLELYHRVSDDTRDIFIKMMNSFDRLHEDRKEFALQVILAALGDRE